MKGFSATCCLTLAGLLWIAPPAFALPDLNPRERAVDDASEQDLVGDGTHPLPAKVAGDTTWIADWTFDAPDGSCDDTGWTHLDNRIMNDGSNYWHIDTTFNGINGISNKAAILSKHDLCWAVPTGYGNSWDYSIVCKYRGTGSTLSFNFVSDSEPDFDYFTVEADSAGVSELRVNYAVDPSTTSSAPFRDQLLSYGGLQTAASVSGLALPDFGVPATTHEVYLRFVSDNGYSDEDGYYASHWGAGLVVDNIAIAGGLTYTEDFEAALNPNVTLVNTANIQPFGMWARLYRHITDNDRCGENTTCAWLWSDPTRIALFSDMAFGPGSAVLRNWLDEVLLGPWVSLASTPTATNTVLTWRRNASQRSSQSRICQNWSVRTKKNVDNTDTPAPGDSVECVGYWSHASSWTTFNSFVWGTNIWDVSSYVPASAREVQLRVRTADTQLDYLFGDPAPGGTMDPGPGPFIDRIRIGRRVLSGPVWNVGIDTRNQAQDCFPTEIFPGICCGQHFRPNTDTSAPLYPYLFGTCAFSEGTDLAINATSARLIPGDSIYVWSVTDQRGVGGITSVKLYGAIVAGPHAGKAPAPWTVGANGFFEVRADSCRNWAGTWVTNMWFVDLDDTYFRGGDKLVYFWLASDAAGAKTSLPAGITAATLPPASAAAAEELTGGLFEVSFLPTIDWDPAYLARIAAHPTGDIDPTAAEVAGSSQRSCILYYQHYNFNRRSGAVNRTAFMYALDRLGYSGYYDVFDCQGYGNTNNQVGGRATMAQSSGYALIIQDSGRGTIPDTPDGMSLDAEKINQCQWYRNYLAQGASGRAGTATLWMIGENTAAEKPANPLFSTDLGLTAIGNDQALAINPDVLGVTSVPTWNDCSLNFTDDLFALNGGCPSMRAYDKASAAGTAAVTHKYKAGATLGAGAIIMNKNVAQHWNTVWMGFGWFDIRNSSGTPASPDPSISLLQKILSCVLPENCRRSPGPTGTGGDPLAALPRVSALFQNTPNPFNPTTTIHFDLAHEGHVALRIYDVAGRVVKTLVDGKLAPGRNLSATWSGNTESGARAPSGVYFYRLVTDDYAATKKMVLMK